MEKYYDMLMQDIRFVEGLNACMGCGICTAICPAAQFYDYDPRQIVLQVQSKDDEVIEKLLKGNTIWYCGQCLSCKPRCPRGNVPGFIIQALRALSQKLGFFICSEKGRQQLAIKRTVGENIQHIGYCIHPNRLKPEMHMEQGPVWEWVYNNDAAVFNRFGDNYKSSGAGNMRDLDDDVIKDIENIFDVSGGSAFFDNIEKYSEEYAKSIGYPSANDDYFDMVYTTNTENENE